MGTVRIGVDLGKKQDYSAIVAVETVDMKEDEFDVPVFERVPLEISWHGVTDRLIEVRDGIINTLAQRARGTGKIPSVIDEILVDQSGLGDPVVEEMRARGLKVTGVLLTGGNRITQERRTLHIPKSALVSRLQVLFGGHRIHFAKHDPLAEEMIEELENFKLKVTQSANLQFEPFKTGGHDDLIVALGLACWRRSQGESKFKPRLYMG